MEQVIEFYKSVLSNAGYNNAIHEYYESANYNYDFCDVCEKSAKYIQFYNIDGTICELHIKGSVICCCTDEYCSTWFSIGSCVYMYWKKNTGLVNDMVKKVLKVRENMLRLPLSFDRNYLKELCATAGKLYKNANVDGVIIKLQNILTKNEIIKKQKQTLISDLSKYQTLVKNIAKICNSVVKSIDETIRIVNNIISQDEKLVHLIGRDNIYKQDWDFDNIKDIQSCLIINGIKFIKAYEIDKNLSNAENEINNCKLLNSPLRHLRIGD